MDALQSTFEARRSAQEQLKGLYDEHGVSDLPAEVRAQEERLAAEIRDLQEREGNLIEAAAKAKAADEARAASGVPVPVPAAAPKPTLEQKLQGLKTGEYRSVEIGYEARDAVDLVKGTATDGAELVESSLLGQIHDLVEEYSPIMGLSRVIRTAGGADLVVPRVTSHSAASLVAEAGLIGEDAPQFDTVTLGAYKYAFAVQISRELEQDSAFNVAGFVIEQGSAALGRGLDAAFVTGSGSSQPQGVDLATTGVTAAATGAVTMDELIELQHSVIAPQRSAAVFVMNDSTLEAIRKLKDGDSNYLWRPSNVAGQPDTLLGSPVYENPNVAAMATGVNSIIFGDMSGFYIRMAGGVTVDRSEHVGFLNDLVTYRFLVRADSKIVDTTGIRVLTQA